MDRYTPEEIEKRLQCKTFEELSSELQQLNPGIKGFSEKSVKRFCVRHNIKKRRSSLQLSNNDLDGLVSAAVSEVGDAYGRRMMKGYLDSKTEGHCVASECRVGESLKRVSSDKALRERAYGPRKMDNPSVYSACYFGEKWHIDQNEKLVRYGVVVVCMTDGYSRLIVGSSVMANKNNIIIYDEVYRPAILKYGLVSQLRADHGLEFCLIEAVQSSLSHLRVKQDKLAVVTTTSTHNLPIERFWCEVNVRVLYPIKKQLVMLEDMGSLFIDVDKPAISTVCQKLVRIGLRRCIDAWNSHHIRGRGRPDVLSKDTSSIYKITGNEVPDTATAVSLYPGQLTPQPIVNQLTDQILEAQIDFEHVYSSILREECDQLLQSIVTCKSLG